MLFNLQVVGLARRKERIEELSEKLKDKEGKLYAYKADVTKEEDIFAAFDWVNKNVGPVSILINNAGLARNTTIVDGKECSSYKSEQKLIINLLRAYISLVFLLLKVNLVFHFSR